MNGCRRTIILEHYIVFIFLPRVYDTQNNASSTPSDTMNFFKLSFLPGLFLRCILKPRILINPMEPSYLVLYLKHLNKNSFKTRLHLLNCIPINFCLIRSFWIISSYITSSRWPWRSFELLRDLQIVSQRNLPALSLCEIFWERK